MQSLMGETPKTALHRFSIRPCPLLICLKVNSGLKLFWTSLNRLGWLPFNAAR
ncbi:MULTISPECIES: hypothetical protein [unclassified Moorena]|uniref:hypothetical protein n=1 Tax=unclassified Moorena TaxID=2683338 RepID=UPI001401A77F|nr:MULTISPECIES: hypothetical protein [unclassified Moorena]NEO14003.1 hypothetical protein [Moorena sp. SIO3E8]NEQ00428.1 hypothetical protein [Moorena sp. SIO3F7]